MKKTNFISFHSKMWNVRGLRVMVLSCFMMLFVGLQSVSAQYYSSAEVVDVAKKELQIMNENAPAAAKVKLAVATAEGKAFELKKRYLNFVIERVKGDGYSVGAAIQLFHDKSVAKSPQSSAELNAVKAEIINLLSL